jgi:hypothetical protein
MSKHIKEMVKSNKRFFKFCLVFAAVFALVIVPITDLGNKINVLKTSADIVVWKTDDATFTCDTHKSNEILSVDTTATNSTTLTVPSEINGVTITSINGAAFNGTSIVNARSVVELTLPATITSIPKNTFNNMYNLVNINVDPENPNYMSYNGMLYSKDGTTLLSVPQNTPSTRIDYRVLSPNVTTIGSNSFYSNKSVSDVTFPNTVTTVADDVFNGTNIRTVYFASSLQHLGRAFNNNPSLTAVDVQTGTYDWTSFNGVLYDYSENKIILYPAGKTDDSFTMRASVTTIGTKAFQGAVNLKTINFNGNERIIESNAFDGCGITEFIAPAALEQIGDESFANCAELKKVDMSGAKILRIGISTFSPCEALTDCILSDFTQEIPYSVFAGNTSLTNVVLPKGLITIDEGAFAGCIALTQIALPGRLESIAATSFTGTQISSFYLGSKIKKNIPNFTDSIFLMTSDADGVTSIGKVTIVGYSTVSSTVNELQDDGTVKAVTKTVDSAAKKYADENGCDFLDLGEFIEKQGDLDGDGKVTPEELNAVIRAVLNQQIVDSNWLAFTATDTTFDGEDITTSKRDILKQLRAAMEREKLEPTEPTDVEPTEPTDVEPTEPTDVEPTEPTDVEPTEPTEPTDEPTA